MSNLDVMTLAYLLVLAANLALILLVGNLAVDRARDAWNGIASRARQAQTQLSHLHDSAEAASTRTSEAVVKIEEAQHKLATAERELAAVKTRQDSEPLPYVYCVTPPENFDLGGTVWEFLAQHESEAQAERDPHHHARHWHNGRLYMVQAATQLAAKRQLERHLSEADGFRITMVRQHGASLLAEAS